MSLVKKKWTIEFCGVSLVKKKWTIPRATPSNLRARHRSSMDGRERQTCGRRTLVTVLIRSTGLVGVRVRVRSRPEGIISDPVLARLSVPARTPWDPMGSTCLPRIQARAIDVLRLVLQPHISKQPHTARGNEKCPTQCEQNKSL